MPLKQTLGKPDTSGRLIKWAIELSEYDISYLPGTTIKAQALADFISEVTGAPPEESPGTRDDCYTWADPLPSKEVERYSHHLS
ncbi:UNVERIFIED_CONTAM: hypothetical protein Slati_2662000 [Sesamum latifolium]|uniref:Uncharacterized protein n=1 Tax=Sesamum latifolium TaxID=2727402 RepID=A0AAW2VZ43_9LAMI